MKRFSRLLVIAVVLNLVVLGVIAFMALFPSATPDSQVITSTQPGGKSSSPDKLKYLPASSLAWQSQPDAGETPVAADISSSPSTVTPEVSSTPQSQPPSQAPASVSQISVPVALIDPDPSMNFDEDQLQMLENMRQDFADTVGGENQNPADKEYVRRWQEAQPEFDARFRSVFGTAAFNKLQTQAARQEPNVPH